MKKLPKINRRDFLTLFGLTSAAAGCPAMASAMQASDPDKQYKTFQATCSMECLHCNLRAYVKDGVIEKLEMQMPLTENLVLEVFLESNGFTPKTEFFIR